MKRAPNIHAFSHHLPPEKSHIAVTAFAPARPTPKGRGLTSAFSTGKKTLMRQVRALCLVAGMWAHGAAYGASADERFAQASAAYDEQRYEESIAQFEELLAEGRRAPELFFNLANAYYRAGAPAHAILHYRHAQYLAPRDADIRHNLVFVAQQTGALLPQPATIIRWLGLLSVSEWAILATAGWWLTAVYLCLALWPTTQQGRRIGVSLSALLLIVSVTGAHHWFGLRARPEVVVTEPGVEALFAPINGYTPHFALPPGSIARIDATVVGWHKVRVGDKEGWIQQSAVMPVNPWRVSPVGSVRP